MAKFEPSDFSPIHEHPARPSRPGWYCTEHRRPRGLFEGIHEGKEEHAADEGFFARWDGEVWHSSDGGHVLYPYQDYAWFGLKEPA